MNDKNEIEHPLRESAIGKMAMLGAAIALVLISIFLWNAGEPDPSWPRLWMIRPLIIVPAAGAVGGAFYQFLGHMGEPGSLTRISGKIAGLVVYIIGLWLGTVLGLDGTWWD